MKLDLINFINENKISLGMSENTSEVRFINEYVGYGRFATTHIPKDSIIYRWGTMWLTIDEKRNFAKDYFINVEDKFMFQGGLTPDLNGSHNHSCSPNAYVEDLTTRALRDISPNEEITLDYATFVVHDYIILEKCNCKSLECRGKITGQDWKIHNLAQKYKNRVSGQVIRLSEGIQKI